MRPVFDGSDHHTGLSLTSEMVREAEEKLGYTLPKTYVALLRERNGGGLLARCYPTPFPTSWADDHIQVDALLGLGGERGIDGPFGSGYMIQEWGYPDIGIVAFDVPSGGHDAVLLDYSDCGLHGEPAVTYVDEDRVPRRVADTLADFIAGLRQCEDFED